MTAHLLVLACVIRAVGQAAEEHALEAVPAVAPDPVEEAVVVLAIMTIAEAAVRAIVRSDVLWNVTMVAAETVKQDVLEDAKTHVRKLVAVFAVKSAKGHVKEIVGLDAKEVVRAIVAMDVETLVIKIALRVALLAIVPSVVQGGAAIPAPGMDVLAIVAAHVAMRAVLVVLEVAVVAVAMHVIVDVLSGVPEDAKVVATLLALQLVVIIARVDVPIKRYMVNIWIQELKCF